MVSWPRRFSTTPMPLKMAWNTIWRGFVSSNFPLFQSDFLIKDDGVFGGLVKRQLNEGNLAAVSNPYWTLSSIAGCNNQANVNFNSGMSCMGVLPVKVYVSSCNVVVEYDYFTPSLRTVVSHQILPHPS
jgi:hypothetical protein